MRITRFSEDSTTIDLRIEWLHGSADGINPNSPTSCNQYVTMNDVKYDLTTSTDGHSLTAHPKAASPLFFRYHSSFATVILCLLELLDPYLSYNCAFRDLVTPATRTQRHPHSTDANAMHLRLSAYASQARGSDDMPQLKERCT